MDENPKANPQEFILSQDPFREDLQVKKITGLDIAFTISVVYATGFVGYSIFYLSKKLWKWSQEMRVGKSAQRKRRREFQAAGQVVDPLDRPMRFLLSERMEDEPTLQPENDDLSDRITRPQFKENQSDEYEDEVTNVRDQNSPKDS